MQSNLLQKELERLETSHSFRELLLFIHNWRRKRSPKGRSILFSSLMVFPDDFFYHFTKFESFRNSITFFWGQLVIIAKYYSLCCLPTYFPKRPFKPTFVESGLFTCRKKPFIGLRSPREANRRLREQNQLAFRLNCQFYSWLTVSDIYLIFVIFGPLMGFYLTNIFFFAKAKIKVHGRPCVFTFSCYWGINLIAAVKVETRHFWNVPWTCQNFKSPIYI